MILVTGGAGYVGSHFLHEYVRQGRNDIMVLDNMTIGHEKAIPREAKLYRANIGDRKALDELFESHPIDAVVHFAANAYVGESQEDPFKYLQNNVVQTINLFESMEQHGVRKIVFSSTCASYGVPQYVPIDENHPQNPVNVYGSTKLMVERILHGLADTKKWSFVALRYFNAAGAALDGTIGESHDPETHLIPLVLKGALHSQAHVTIHGDDYDTRDGTCIRDYIHVTDLADAHIRALKLLQDRQATVECINLGTEHGATVKEVIAVAEEVTGRKVSVQTGPRRSGDPPALVANATKAATVLGWKAKHDLRAIVETAWKWEQDRQY